jgi:hypothetical protein
VPCPDQPRSICELIERTDHLYETLFADVADTPENEEGDRDR